MYCRFRDPPNVKPDLGPDFVQQFHFRQRKRVRHARAFQPARADTTHGFFGLTLKAAASRRFRDGQDLIVDGQCSLRRSPVVGVDSDVADRSIDKEVVHAVFDEAAVEL